MSAHVGYFGKLAFQGDFVRRDLPPGFLPVWDGWLQSGIVASREALGSAWLEYYATSPIWRFALGSGIAGPQALVGVLMPSQDRVNRFFPLTLVTPIAAEMAEAALADETAMTAMEEAGLGALDIEGDRAGFDAAIRALPLPTAGAGVFLKGSIWRAVLRGEHLEHRFSGLPDPAAFREFLAPRPRQCGGEAA